MHRVCSLRRVVGCRKPGARESIRAQMQKGASTVALMHSISNSNWTRGRVRVRFPKIGDLRANRASQPFEGRSTRTVVINTAIPDME